MAELGHELRSRHSGSTHPALWPRSQLAPGSASLVFSPTLKCLLCLTAWPWAKGRLRAGSKWIVLAGHSRAKMCGFLFFVNIFKNWVIILLLYLHNSVTLIYLQSCVTITTDIEIFLGLHPAHRTLILQPGIEPVPPILEELSLVLAAGPPGKSLYCFFSMPRPTFRQEWSRGESWRSGSCWPLPGMSQASVILWGGGWGRHSGLSLSLFPSPP